ncbi:DNA polymerase III subunit alpha [Bacillus sp. 165]|uniref:DNA polymerase III subunit alpha n=1 Tax=Bacillus sp. 165 TaxID=1529117 RepID=UPI001ADC64F5|nr:DNA polymerase III subunit alpha [Bacillus sp. 165]MBO9130621.1 DNA polymerase III subunit alpha [Bacillus sp. 165]
MSFVHLQVRTAFSLLSSTCSIESLVKQAKRLGFQALAVTDENVMYGVLPFYKMCKKEGVKPIIGLTASVWNEEEEKAYPLILLAKNYTGYRNLIKISSSIATKSKQGIPKKWLARYAEEIIAVTPGMEGEIEQLLLSNKDEEAASYVKQYQQMFPEFYLNLQNHLIKEERLINAKLLKLSEQLNIPLTVTNDVRYIQKEDALVHECLLSIGQGTKLSDVQRPRLHTDQYYLKTTEEMEELFDYLPEALENSQKIASLCNVDIPFGQSQLPKYPVPTEETSEEFLERICKEGLQKRYGEVKEIHLRRLQHELDIITRMKFSDYFLIVWDFMKYAHEHRILTGPGRGSAAGSLVSYVLEITDIDPLQYDLLFERFLNPERITMPDIDIDFPDIRRDEVIQYVVNKYGQLHAAQIVTFGTLAAKAAIRDTGRVMGLSQRELDTFARLIPSRIGITLQEAYDESVLLREHVEYSPLYEQVFQIARKVEGLPRHTSIHAAGVIMSRSPLTDIAPIQEGHQDVFLTQYPAEVLEELGMLKMDFLGLRNLTLLETVRNSIKEKQNLRKVPLDDANTFALMCNGDTTGVFQFESAGMRKVLMELKPTEFEDIVAVNALYRPGPMEQIPLYIESKHNKRPITYPHPDLKPILQKTYGVIVYQEQIMQIASVMAGFSLGEADMLRRAVSKKDKEVLDSERAHFVTGCLHKGYNEKTAHDVYDLIVRFANYGFNRSHAVAYSMIAYQLAYLKANYPTEFAAALLSSAVGNEDKVASYIRETQRKGISVLPPSILKSGYRFTVEGGKIRYGLLAIRSIGMATVKDIIEERNKKRFTDLFDFCVRIPPKSMNRRTLEALISGGCFDEFGENRASLLASIDAALEYAELVRPDESGQIDMFLDDIIPKPNYVKMEELGSLEQLTLEKEALGLYLSSYPTSVYRPLAKELRMPSLAEAVEHKPKFARAIVYISGCRIIRTKKMQKMAFLTICDESTEMEAVLFPDSYLSNFSLVAEGKVALIEGTVTRRNDTSQFIVNGIYALDKAEEYETDKAKSVYIKLPSENDKMLISTITKTLFQYPGYAAVYIYYEKEHKMVQLARGFSIHPVDNCLQNLKELAGEENVVLKIR